MTGYVALGIAQFPGCQLKSINDLLIDLLRGSRGGGYIMLFRSLELISGL